MAKKDVTITLKNAVVMGAGDKVKTYASGSTVQVPDELATQLVEAGAAVLHEEPAQAAPESPV